MSAPIPIGATVRCEYRHTCWHGVTGRVIGLPTIEMGGVDLGLLVEIPNPYAEGTVVLPVEWVQQIAAAVVPM